MDPTAGWGAIRYDGSSGQAGAVETKLYVLAQFTRHIRPGMRIINTGVNYAVAAHDPAAQRLVIVAANNGAAQTLTFNLSAFDTVPNGTATRWSTLTSGSGDRYTRRQDLTVSGKLVRVPFAAGAVQTIQVDGVVR
jgi:galactan endo-1,6-beta-galactosidase